MTEVTLETDTEVTPEIVGLEVDLAVDLEIDLEQEVDQEQGLKVDQEVQAIQIQEEENILIDPDPKDILVLNDQGLGVKVDLDLGVTEVDLKVNIVEPEIGLTVVSPSRDIGLIVTNLDNIQILILQADPAVILVRNIRSQENTRNLNIESILN